jgi:uncharacterized protein YbbK (DUF523 family)
MKSSAREMTNAYANGDYKRALKLSRNLDKQILKHYSDSCNTEKASKKSKDLEI